MKSLVLLSSLLLTTGAALAVTPENGSAGKPKVATPQAAQASAASVPFPGVWTGSFAGDSEGTINVVVSADNIAQVTCVTYETGRTFELSGPVEPSGSVTAIEKSFGPSGIKVRFKGQLSNHGTATGTWDNAFFGLKGTWKAERKSDLLRELAPAK
jgi:hypothetical protein